MELNQTGPPLCQVSHMAPFFTLHINDIESEIRLFADDCVCYRKIKDIRCQKEYGGYIETSEGY